jgi:hypothetical protein
MKTTPISILALAAAMMTLLVCSTLEAGDDQGPMTVGVLENRNFAYAAMMKNSFKLAKMDAAFRWANAVSV